MSRGFGSTLGIGTTDAITTTPINPAPYRTVAIWTYRNGAGGSSGGRIWAHRTGATDGGYFYNSNPNSQYAYEHTWSTQVGKWGVPFPATGIWVHCVVSYGSSDAANAPVIYLNGISQTVTTNLAAIGTVGTNTDAYVIGNVVGVRVWDGYLADFAVWDRILTPQEVWLIYSGQSPDHFKVSLTEYLPLAGPSLESKAHQLTAVATGTKVATQSPKRIITPTKTYRPFFMDPLLGVRQPWKFQGGMGPLIAQ